jgi:hypothetical protein
MRYEHLFFLYFLTGKSHQVFTPISKNPLVKSVAIDESDLSC